MKVVEAERSSAERVNSTLKDNYSGRNVRMKGVSKVMTFNVLGIVSITPMQIFRLLLLTIPLIVTVFISCQNSNSKNNNLRTVETGPCSQGEYKIYKSSINILNYNELPYNKGTASLKKKKHYDDNSIPLHIYQDKENYHPVVIAQYGLHLIDLYNTSKDNKYLEQVKKISDKLIGISLAINSALFFPYTFDFPVHDYKDKEEIIHSPWYSGMAQGQILSLFTRLYEITKEKKYLQVSRRILNSFLFLKCDNDTIWITCVDQNGFLWIEEYPITPPCHTLNGMIFAIYGLYDFYRITNDPTSEKLLRGAIETIKFNIHEFRIPNEISRYCLYYSLRHPKIQKMAYHKIHIKQLEMLYKITGEKYFLEMSQTFANDTKKIASK